MNVRALFKRYRFHTANTRQILRRQSLLKLFFIIVFASALEYGMYRLFLSGFTFLDQLGGIGLMIIDRLFALFFFGLFSMLVVSSIVTSYATFFRSDDMRFLLVRPFTASDLTTYKYFESTMWSSWAFMFTILPFIGAYAAHEHLHLSFVVWTLLFSIPFLFLACALGNILLLLVVRILLAFRAFKYILIALAVGSVAGLLIYSGQIYEPDGDLQLNLAKLVPGITLAVNPLLPSYWTSEGILATAEGHMSRALMFLLVSVSSSLMLIMLMQRAGNRFFIDSWMFSNEGNSPRKTRKVLLRPLHGMLSFLPDDVRAVFLKDARTFLRDAAQWSQVLIFFGMLALYFSNLRSFNYHKFAPSWRNTIAFLNVFSVSAVMTSIGSRFIYPQLSLEGQSFWVIGLAPTTMVRVLVTKFITSIIFMTGVSVWLMTLSCGMLGVNLATRIIAYSLAVAISFAVCGLSTGLGAVFIDLTQRNPSAIVSGFGGTLNLVLSLGFLLTAIFPYGLAFQSKLTGKISEAVFNRAIVGCSIWLLLITLLATVLPIYLGARALTKRDF
jgi:ABC-2 type transport system permease protein